MAAPRPGEYAFAKASAGRADYSLGVLLRPRAVLQVDGDGDGVLEGTLYPVSDPLGSVEVLLDEAGRLVERVETLPEGKPRIFGEDRKRPEVLRVVWTGNGETAAGQVPAGILELTFSEPMRQGSLAKARITLAGQEIAPEHVQLSENGRRVLVAASPVAGQQVTLRVEGLEDRSGNVMQPLEVSFTVAGSAQYQVLIDAASPQVLAVLDEGEGVSLLFDEPVLPAAGMELGSSITVTRAGAPVAGSVTRISPWQLAWKRSDPNAWLLGGEYRLSVTGLVELGPEQKPVSSSLLPASFTHLASGSEKILVATPSPETPPRALSAFGNTTLFQGRLWVPELGLYSYRARWYDPELGDFLERDPLGPVDSPNLYQALGRNPINITDPQGLYEKDFHFYAVYYLARAAGFARQYAELLAWSSQFVDNYDHTQPLTIDSSTLAAFHFLAPIRLIGNPPLPAYGRVRRANEIARRSRDRAAETGNLIALGIALHSWADTFAHEGFTANMFDPGNARPGFGFEPAPAWKQARDRVVGELVKTGHSAAGHSPDWTFENPASVQKAMEAAQSIYDFLTELTRRQDYQRYAGDPVKPWPKIEGKLRDLFSLQIPSESEREEKWSDAILDEFIEGVRYNENSPPVPGAVEEFKRWAEEQRWFVLEEERCYTGKAWFCR